MELESKLESESGLEYIASRVVMRRWRRVQWRRVFFLVGEGGEVDMEEVEVEWEWKWTLKVGG